MISLSSPYFSLLSLQNRLSRTALVIIVIMGIIAVGILLGLWWNTRQIGLLEAQAQVQAQAQSGQSQSTSLLDLEEAAEQPVRPGGTNKFSDENDLL